MARHCCSRRCAARSPGCGTSLPMPATPERSCARHWPSWGSEPSTSSGDLRRPSASNHCHGAGWWSAPSPGSIETGASQRTSKQRSKAHRLGSSSPASSCSRAASPGSLPQPSNYKSNSKTKGGTAMFGGTVGIIIQLIAGAVGGNIVGGLAKQLDLGVLWNSVAGIVGGGIGVNSPRPRSTPMRSVRKSNQSRLACGEWSSELTMRPR